MTAKRLITIGFVLMLVLYLFVDVLSGGPATDWELFERRLPSIIETSGLRVLEESTKGPEAVPLPFIHQLRSSLSWPKTGPHVTTGFPESVSHLVLGRDDGPVLHCLVRYHEGKVACIVIRSTLGAKQEGRALRDAITKAFPNLSITLEDIIP
ncbi:hypothetical protein [Prosthecobacter sp.]|uniref:hypothetical protein n=1 Tax=Prosthecobacter sp. TaxID=1965333 RepID=UPI002AB95ED8|nr:hypothetical protein [Prosthecobacter sp.]MDZ4405916.1 hypothetical protein [Prosthecobacter sp.]